MTRPKSPQTVERDADGRLVWVGPQAPDRHPPFDHGNEVALVHGAFSRRSLGARADEVRTDLLAVYEHLAAPEQAVMVDLLAGAVARVELAHGAIEDGRAASPRLIEAASAAANVVLKISERLGLDVRSAAELRLLSAQAGLSTAALAREAPQVVAALRGALADVGLSPEQVADVELAFARRLHGA